jgi:hypothetical protein
MALEPLPSDGRGWVEGDLTATEGDPVWFPTKAKNLVAARGDPRAACRIRLMLHGALATIDLDHQSFFQADQVNDVTADRALTSELVALHLLAPQPFPEQALGVGHLFSQGLGNRAARHCLDRPRPVPSRGGGRLLRVPIPAVGCAKRSVPICLPAGRSPSRCGESEGVVRAPGEACTRRRIEMLARGCDPRHGLTAVKGWSLRPG